MLRAQLPPRPAPPSLRCEAALRDEVAWLRGGAPAERRGFEPLVPLRAHLISKANTRPAISQALKMKGTSRVR